MNKTSTQFISFDNIDTDEIDLFGDAFGIDFGYTDITGLFESIRPSKPDGNLIESLIDKIRKIH